MRTCRSSSFGSWGRLGFYFAAAVFWGPVCIAEGASLGTWPQGNVGRPSNTYINGIAYGNGTWVAVGERGFIATSTDGAKWSKRSAGIKRDFNDVTFTGSRFVAVAKVTAIGAPEAKIFVSDTTGASWQGRDTDVGTNDIGEGMHGVGSNGSGGLVAVGGASLSRITYSTDHGNTWHAVNLGPFGGPWGKLYSVAYGNGSWFAAGSATVLRSSDGGVSWSKISSQSGRDIAFGNGRWILADDAADQLKWSADGETWTACRIGSDTGSTNFSWLNGCTFYDGLFVAVGEYGNIWTSENGRIFQEWAGAAREPHGADMVCVGGGEPGFMAGGVDFGSANIYGAVWPSPPWMRARLGSTWDYPYTVFDGEDGPPRRIGLPQYQVNTSSLNLLLEGTLFYMETLGAPVNLRLVYNSAPTEDGSDAIGLFGKNWRFRYETVIGQFGPDARMITGGGRTLLFTTPRGQDLSTATTGSPITLVPPEGIFDELKFYGPGQYFEYKEKASKLVYRYGVAGGPGNSLWRLTRITDRNGNQINLVVDAATGRISSLTDTPSGRQVTFTYDTAQNLCTGITVPGGRIIRFYYDTDGQKNLIRITDMAGYSGSYQYDKRGYMTEMSLSGRSTKFAYNPRPGYEDKDSPQDNAGDKILASVTDSAGGVTAYEKLPGDNGVRRTDPRGNVTVFKSQTGQTSRVTDPLGNIRQLTFSAAKLPETFSDAEGNLTGFEYDARGNMTKTTDALGVATSYGYDARDNMTSRVDGLGRMTSYSYDANDRLTRITTQMGNQTNITYQTNGRINAIKDARNNTSSLQFDTSGNLTRATDPLGNAVQFTHDLCGRPTGSTDARGKTKTFTYDGNDRLTRVTYTSAPGSPQRNNGYDAFGQTACTDEMGQVTLVARNDFGFPTSVTDPLGNTLLKVYDPSNNPIEVTDPAGRISKTSYDSANRPLVMTDPRGKQAARDYDDNGNLVAFTDRKKNKTTFKYDANNRLIETSDALGNTRANARNEVGRITSVTNARGQQVGYTYDLDGRLTEKRYKEDPGSAFATEAAFTRDANGNITRMTDDWGTTDYTYNANNRVVTIRYPTGKTVAFTYNPSGLPATITYPNGMVVTYTYDNFNRITSPLIGRSGHLLGNAEKSPQVLAVQMSSGGNTRTISYTCNAAALPTLADRPVDVPDTTYTYDAANRLQSIVHGSGSSVKLTMQYSLDAGGNLVSEDVSGPWMLGPIASPNAKMTYGKCNQLASRNGVSYSYDADGNLTAASDGSFSAVYTPENRPSQIERNSGGTVESIAYTYDGNGLRVKRAVGGGATVQFHYGPGDQLLFTTDGAGTLTTCYIWRGGSLAAMMVGNSVLTDLRYPLLNHLGSVVAVANPAGLFDTNYGYQPPGGYAVLTAGTSADPKLFTFVGGLGVQDEGSALFYMKNRFYDGVSGRFLQRDPMGIEGGMNLYAYARSNPVNGVDPQGLFNWGQAAAFLFNEVAAGAGMAVSVSAFLTTGWTGWGGVGSAWLFASSWNRFVAAGKQLENVDKDDVPTYFMDFLLPGGFVNSTYENQQEAEETFMEQRAAEEQKMENERKAYQEIREQNEANQRMMEKFFPGLNHSYSDDE